jgi:hypothetical protein
MIDTDMSENYYCKCYICGRYGLTEHNKSIFYCSIQCQKYYRSCLTCVKPFVTTAESAQQNCSVACQKTYVMIQTNKRNYYVG